MAAASHTPSPAAIAAAAAAAATATPGVARLVSGRLGAVATYGQGRRVAGVRVIAGPPPRVTVHVAVGLDRPLRDVADDVHERIRRALAELAVTDADVAVHVADVDATTFPTAAAAAAQPSTQEGVR